MIAIPRQPVALTVAGSDSCGGAGIQADLKTFAALDVHGTSAITAVTAQNRTGVAAVEVLPVEIIRRQIEMAAEDMAIAAVKTGMLANAEVIIAVAGSLRALKTKNLVVDPVIVATSGARLLVDDGFDALCHELLPMAALITPNLDEAAQLLGTDIAQDEAAMERQAVELSERFGTAILLKGGHLHNARQERSQTAADVLAHDGATTWFQSPVVTDADTHGTGCTLSAAITAALAKGAELEPAIDSAKAFVTERLRLSVGV